MRRRVTWPLIVTHAGLKMVTEKISQNRRSPERCQADILLTYVFQLRCPVDGRIDLVAFTVQRSRYRAERLVIIEIGPTQHVLVTAVEVEVGLEQVVTLVQHCRVPKKLAGFHGIFTLKCMRL